MKRIIGTLCVATVCISAHAQRVETYKLNNIELHKRYNSYSMLTDDETPVNTRETIVQAVETDSGDGHPIVYTIESWTSEYPEEDSVIQEAISYKFAVEGIRRSKVNPDMLIQYHIYDKQYSKNPSYLRSISQYQYTYPLKEDLISNISDGTLIVSIIDAKSGKSVWEGYAYKVYDREKSVEENDMKIAQAMDELLGEFYADMHES